MMIANPAEGIQMDRVHTNVRERWCSYEQRDKLCAEVLQPIHDDKGKELWPGNRMDLAFALYCGFHAGMRRGEVIAARPGWFHLHTRQIHIPCKPGEFVPKGKRARTIPLTDEFAAFLGDYGLREPFMLHPEKLPKEPKQLKSGRGKTTYLRYDYELPLSKYVTAQGLPWVTSHVLRHTYATLALHAEIDPWQVCGWFGDRWQTFEKHYAHHFPRKGAVEKAFSHRQTPTAA